MRQIRAIVRPTRTSVREVAGSREDDVHRYRAACSKKAVRRTAFLISGGRYWIWAPARYARMRCLRADAAAALRPKRATGAFASHAGSNPAHIAVIQKAPITRSLYVSGGRYWI